MSLDDFLKAAGVFNQGLSEFASSQALNRANSEIERIKGEIEPGDEQNKELNRVQQTLGFGLARAGMPASQIQTVLGTFSPPADLTKFQEAQLGLQRERIQIDKDQIELAQKQAEAQAALKARQRVEDKTFTVTKDFTKDTKKIRDSIGQAEQAIAQLNTAKDNPVVTKSIQTFLARATGEVGNLTEAEREVFAGNPAWIPRLKRMFTIGLSGKLPQDDVALLKQIAATMGRANRKNLRTRAENTAKRFANTIGVGEQLLFNTLHPFQDDPDAEDTAEFKLQERKQVAQEFIKPKRKKSVRRFLGGGVK